MLPTFETERLLLRPRTMADFDACLAMDREPGVTQYIAGPWDDLRAHERFLAERIQADWAPGLGYWSIFAKQQPDLFLGWILLLPYDAVGPQVEIGWRLRRAAWGRGYAAEAARAVAAHAFETVGLPRIVADIDARNLQSLRIAEKIGMTACGEGVWDGGRPYKAYVLTQDAARPAHPQKS